MYIGLDLGTSGLKVVVLDSKDNIVWIKDYHYPAHQPKALWSEQDPEEWWKACLAAFADLSKDDLLKNIKGIGIGGQMHGAVMLDKQGEVLRPAILWNDGRSYKECAELEAAVSNSREVTGNIMMPGFTAPKVLWVKHNEPEIFAKIDKVLLPKDYLRFKLSGEFYSEMSDAAGTMWLDTANRSWYEPLLHACGIGLEHMPSLVEGSSASTTLKTEIADQFGMQTVVIAGGGGDNAAAAVGMGTVNAGDAMLSLGTSGVIFSVSERFQSNSTDAVHSFCHALPNLWHLMSVHLSAASCVQWFADNAGNQSVKELASPEALSTVDVARAPLFLPYLSGERTPLNNPFATANFFGLTTATDAQDMMYAILEGVAFSFKNGLDAMRKAGAHIESLDVLGGGAQNPFWRDLIASVLNCSIHYRDGAEVAAARGGARLALLACEADAKAAEVCQKAKLISSHEADSTKSALLEQRYAKFLALQTALSPLFVE